MHCERINGASVPRPERIAAAVGRLFVIGVLAAFSASCGPSKAHIDYTMSERILWPGKPEKPRIKYLWSLRRIAGGGEAGKIERLIIGGEEFDPAEPASSETVVYPHGLFLDKENRLYIADPGALRVNVIDLKTGDSFYFNEAEEGSLRYPIGIAADQTGRIFVTDPELTKVAVFSPKGKFLSFLEGPFKRPTGIAFDAARSVLYVSDTWEHKIYTYGLDGKRVGSIGQRGSGPGEFNFPTHVAVGPGGLIYVSDSVNFRVQIFDADGRFIKQFGTAGDTFDRFDKIKGIAVDREGHIYVVDSARDTVNIYDWEGRLLLFFGKRGRFYGDFFLPTGIFVDLDGRIFVSDSFNMRVQAFQFLGGD